MSVKKDKTPEKAPSRFDEIMKNPVKKVYENNRALEQLAKRMKNMMLYSF
mgnify:FL=1